MFAGTEVRAFAAPCVQGARASPGGAALGRNRLDALVDRAKELGAKGLAWFRVDAATTAGRRSTRRSTSSSPTPSGPACVRGHRRRGRRPGAGGGRRVAHGLRRCSGQLRLDLGRPPVSEGPRRFCWVTDFPLFDGVDDDGPARGRPPPVHHAPPRRPRRCSSSDPLAVRSQAYDLVLNGWELGSGAIRIHREDIQRRVFDALGITAEEAEARFGFLLGAFRYGAPPHGGFAVGVDRLVAMLAGEENIREVIAFPKTQSGHRPHDRRAQGAGPAPARPSLGHRAVAAAGDADVEPSGARCRSGAATSSTPRPRDRLASAGAAGGPDAAPHPRRDRRPAPPGRPRARRCGRWSSRPADLGDPVGAAGHGKTTLARLVADATAKAFVPLSAVDAGVKRRARGASRRPGAGSASTGQGTILFLDEVHRFNKAQQDALLPGGGGGARRPHRGDHREPVLRGQLPAAQPVDAVAPRAARPTTTCADARPAGPRRRGRRRPTTRPSPRWSSAGRRRRPGRARHPRGGRCARSARGRRRPSPSTTSSGAPEPGGLLPPGATTTTTRSSALHQVASAARTPTPACTGWPACSTAGEDARFIARRLVILASEDVGMADPHGLRGGRRRGPRRRVRRPARGRSSTWPRPSSTWPRAPKSNRVTVALWRAQRRRPGRPAGRRPGPPARRPLPGAGASATARATAIPTTTRRVGGPAVPPGRSRRPRLLRAVDARGRAGDGRAPPGPSSPARGGRPVGRRKGAGSK